MTKNKKLSISPESILESAKQSGAGQTKATESGKKAATSACHYGQNCNKYLRNLQQAAARAREADTLVGADLLGLWSNGVQRFAFITESAVEGGPFSKVLRPNNKSIRQKNWRKPNSQQEVGNLDLLRTMAQNAKEHNKCLDIFLNKHRMRRGDETYLYEVNNQWVGNSTDSNLMQLGVELQGCVGATRGESAISGPRSPCPVGCNAIRVHEIDARIPDQSLLRRQRKMQVPTSMLTDPENKDLEAMLNLFIASEAPANEEDTWKKYRISLYGNNKEQDFTEYVKFRRDIRTRQRRLLAKRERRLERGSRLKFVIVKVFIAWIGYWHKIAGIKITWEMLHMIQVDYYMLLRMLSSYNTLNDDGPGCSADMEGGRFPMHIVCQVDRSELPVLLLSLVLLRKGNEKFVDDMPLEELVYCVQLLMGDSMDAVKKKSRQTTTTKKVWSLGPTFDAGLTVIKKWSGAAQAAQAAGVPSPPMSALVPVFLQYDNLEDFSKHFLDVKN